MGRVLSTMANTKAKCRRTIVRAKQPKQTKSAGDTAVQTKRQKAGERTGGTIVRSKPPTVEEAARKTVQKQRNKFSHFVFTETSPAITPKALVCTALSTSPGVYHPSMSYVLFAHNPVVDPTTSGASTCVYGSSLHTGHYHLILCSAQAVEDALKFRAEADKVFVECSFYQIPVTCPLTEYGSLLLDETTTILEIMGEAFTGLNEVVRSLPFESKIFTRKPDGRRTRTIPSWEYHKQSQIMAQEQLLRLIDYGPFRPVMQRLLAAMADRSGVIHYEQHGWKMDMECGPSEYQCMCGDCSSGHYANMTPSMITPTPRKTLCQSQYQLPQHQQYANVVYTIPNEPETAPTQETPYQSKYQLEEQQQYAEVHAVPNESEAPFPTTAENTKCVYSTIDEEPYRAPGSSPPENTFYTENNSVDNCVATITNYPLDVPTEGFYPPLPDIAMDCILSDVSLSNGGEPIPVVGTNSVPELNFFDEETVPFPTFLYNM